MWFKHRAWIPTAWILAGLNIAGAWFAAGDAEPLHAASHALLATLFALGAQRLQVRALRAATADASTAERLEDIEARLAEIDQLPDVAARLAEVEERVDFAERALVDIRQRAQLPPKK
ncbi:MAG TPA: hypothetical protein VI139_00180 [Gemmatimonadales bacterium]